jgi:hypothetical protein
MKFLISLFKAAKKGDNFRAQDFPDKYNDQIAQLNATGDNQYVKLKNVATAAKTVATGNTSGGTIPGR